MAGAASAFGSGAAAFGMGLFAEETLDTHQTWCLGHVHDLSSWPLDFLPCEGEDSVSSSPRPPTGARKCRNVAPTPLSARQPDMPHVAGRCHLQPPSGSWHRRCVTRSGANERQAGCSAPHAFDPDGVQRRRGGRPWVRTTRRQSRKVPSMEIRRSAVKHRVCWQCGQELWSSLCELAAGANRCRVYWCPQWHEGWLLDEVYDMWQPLGPGDLADWRARFERAGGRSQP